MTSATLTLSARPRLQAWSATALASATIFWFVATVIGQSIFAVYILALYGGSGVRGNFKGWNQVMTHGHVVGDMAGNLVTGAHLLLAMLIMLGGALQLVPQVRRRAPAFHRWNGRVYLAGAAVAALSGLYMVWLRGAVGDMVQHVGTSLNAVLVLFFAGLALRRALQRDVAAHSRWALRLFLAVSGVWFFRVGLMFWIVIHGGPSGFNPDTFTGPFLGFLSYAQYLLPLTVLQLYLLCRDHGGTAARFGMAALLVLCTVAMSIGIVVATMGMWLPNIKW
ncbi:MULTISPECIES: DUF2306 domain-containing protein [unclassified Janthinobacterium]|uniref:DUF2306 domain-containing protein n=1 Tax=unclassified Janthinobacterium TaxID=2610881 RepID=UPI001613B92C|nr:MULTISPECIES: DUF2306 domain-containing protein [unclassified Janthinobacterium]MBB5606347.1 hypothetical protein [Janthinobacterium sp. S3T4]MBB5611781.1 hypothetical protein [Janthinobacterium sp. S3M3]